jgi:dethiobiotin synthetase
MTRKRCGVFVTGTDTGVGKTIVTVTLAVAFQSQGIKTGVMKPIETGAEESGVSDSDWLLGVTKMDGARPLVTPYRLRAAAAPVVAAAAEGVTIDPNRIVSALETLCTENDCVIVEGIGGVLVPLTPDLMVADLIRMMKLPVLIVARSGLGSINHSLLTVDCLRKRGLPIVGLIFNNPTPPQRDAATHRTVPTILQLTGLPSFGELPYCEGLPQTWNEYNKHLRQGIDIEGLEKVLGLRDVA